MEETRCIQVARLTDEKYGKEQNRRVYSPDGIAPTLQTCGGGTPNPKLQNGGIFDEPLALDEQNNAIRWDGTVGTLTTDGSSPKHNNRVIEPCAAAMRGRNPDNPSDRTAGIPTQQRIEFGGEVSNALTTVQKDSLVAEQIDTANYRIRKLTEKECGRLMGVKDEDIEKLGKNLSRSAKYHVFGDSIVSTCLMAIFGELLNIDFKTKIKEVVADITKEKEV